MKLSDKLIKLMDVGGFYFYIILVGFKIWCWCYCFVGCEKLFMLGYYLDMLLVDVCVEWDIVKKYLCDGKDFVVIKKVEKVIGCCKEGEIFVDIVCEWYVL